TQPALSEQIHLLEEAVGAALFDRSRRHVNLTPAGEAFVENGRDILHTVDKLIESARSAGEPFATPIVLGVIPTIAPYFLPKVLGKIRRKAPNLRLFLREEKTKTLLEKIKQGSIDLAVLSLTFDPDPFEIQMLYDEPFVFVCHKGHPLLEQDELRQIDLSNESILLLEEGHCFSNQALDVCQLAGAKSNMEFRASSLSTLIQMVANGLGVTLLPRLAVDVEVKGMSSLEVRPFLPPEPRRRICMAWRKGAAREKEYRILASFFQRMAPASVKSVSG
ncbi:hydrogen peroxide-inducible genes activator, partial [bacterium]|nr:hydrogen peroxide-inducible genes activator [bacterium]